MARNSYIYGSAAPKLPQQGERPIEQQRVVKKEAAQSIPKRTHIPKAKLVFSIVFIVSVCFVILYRFCVITEFNTQMGNLNARYNKLRDENRMLNVEIETSIDLDRVKAIAETKLGMHTPDQYQLVLVNVPKSNYSVVLDYDYIDETTQKTSLMENIVNSAKAILP